MSLYYTPKRTKNIYKPNDVKPFKLSRSKIDLFLECPRCFYIDRRLGMDIYQWLLRRNDLTVSDTGYFVYCNGKTDKGAFDGRLEFDVTLIPYSGNDRWVEDTILDSHQCLNNNHIPGASDNCDYCAYREAAESVILSMK